MATGTLIAGVVLTILSMDSFQEGGIWNIAGVACALGILGIVFMSYREDQKSSSNRSKDGLKEQEKKT